MLLSLIKTDSRKPNQTKRLGSPHLNHETQKKKIGKWEI